MQALSLSGIRYIFSGKELGARRDEPEAYQGQTATYELIAQLPIFRRGLERVHEDSNLHRIALMCAEKDPLQCHRTILVCRNIRREFGSTIFHILDSGALESHDQAEERLIHETGFGSPQIGLFHELDINSPLQLAYRKRGSEMAYRKETP